jgi:hypothetical protein
VYQCAASLLAGRIRLELQTVSIRPQYTGHLANNSGNFVFQEHTDVRILFPANVLLDIGQLLIL